jgi:hypothetical protein
MIQRITPSADGTTECGGRLRNQVHGAGLQPNPMDRFMRTNMHEVLRLVDFST